ncbi:MAG TPA: hypothetical protein VM029_09980, partial [Opitutaceae bacterium]|nr:hypothetical protein [Opitutaceae bacterium]
DRSATSFAYVLGGGFRPSPVLEALVEWEHDMNRLVGERYRILAIVNLTVTKCGGVGATFRAVRRTMPRAPGT